MFISLELRREFIHRKKLKKSGVGEELGDVDESLRENISFVILRLRTPHLRVSPRTSPTDTFSIHIPTLQCSGIRAVENFRRLRFFGGLFPRKKVHMKEYKMRIDDITFTFSTSSTIIYECQ